MVALLVFGALTLSSCEGPKPAAKAPAAPAAPAASAPAASAPAATTARYECPMKCANSQSATPGKCPTCGMDLEKKS